MVPPVCAIALLLLGVAAPASSQSAPGLLEALIANNASQFAAFLQSEPATLQIYLSGRAKTVFAPVDDIRHYGDDKKGDTRRLKVRETPEERQQKLLQACEDETDLAAASQTKPGEDLATLDESALLDGDPQKVVVDSRPEASTVARRGDHGHSYSAQPAPHPTPSPYPPPPAPSSLLRIASGLGNIANVIKGDIRFAGGLIHITDSYFTIPQSLSSTSRATGQTAFVDLADRANLTSTLDTTSSVTVFLPSNGALASVNSTATAAAALVLNHVASGVKYLPDLKDGDTLTTRQGGKVQISFRNGIFYIGEARITKANLVLANGVAHVIDQALLPPRPPPPPPVTGGSGMSQTLSLGFTLGMASGALLLALV